MALNFIRKKDRRIVILAAGAVTLLFLHWLGWIRPVENLISNAMRPVFAYVYSLNNSLRSSYKTAADKRDLSAEIKHLQDTNYKLLNENASLQYLREENRVLRKYVNLFDSAKYNYVLARVVSRDAVSRSTFENNKVIVDKGSKDGLQAGLLVINEDGLAIGKITAVKDNISEVSLITNKDCRFSVATNHNQKTIGIASGDAGLTIRIDFIPQTEEIKEGDILVTSGLESNIPRGFVLGQVAEVNKESSEIWQTAVIEPSASLDNARIVSVLMPPTNK